MAPKGKVLIEKPANVLATDRVRTVNRVGEIGRDVRATGIKVKVDEPPYDNHCSVIPAKVMVEGDFARTPERFQQCDGVGGCPCDPPVRSIGSRMSSMNSRYDSACSRHVTSITTIYRFAAMAALAASIHPFHLLAAKRRLDGWATGKH